MNLTKDNLNKTTIEAKRIPMLIIDYQTKKQ